MERVRVQTTEIPRLDSLDREALLAWIQTLSIIDIPTKTKGLIPLILQDLAGDEIAKAVDTDYMPPIDRVVLFAPHGAYDPKDTAQLAVVLPPEDGKPFWCGVYRERTSFGYTGMARLGTVPNDLIPTQKVESPSQTLQRINTYVSQIPNWLQTQ